MNSSSHDTVAAARPVARAFLLVLLAPAAAGVGYFLGMPETWWLWAAYAVPPTLVVLLLLAVRFARFGMACVPLPPLLLGLFHLVGGPAFDIAATLQHTPDLALEANPVARLLLDSGHSLDFVFAYAAAAQSLLVATFCVLWIALLRHREVWLDLARETRPGSFAAFVKAALGGGGHSWRQFLLPLRPADLPAAYPVLLTLAALLFGGALNRWYCALEWYQLLPWVPYPVVDAAGLLVGLVGLLVWLGARYTSDASVCRDLSPRPQVP